MDNILDNILHTHLNHSVHSMDETIERASSKGINLTDEHWQVIDFVNDLYLNSEYAIPTLRQLRGEPKNGFKQQGGYRYLYQLVPEGAIDTITYLAGFPVQDRAYNGVGITQ